jgi:hypothetical protein
MADNSVVLKGIKRRSGVTYSALTPNIKGFNDAVLIELDFNWLCLMKCLESQYRHLAVGSA